MCCFAKKFGYFIVNNGDQHGDRRVADCRLCFCQVKRMLFLLF